VHRAGGRYELNIYYLYLLPSTLLCLVCYLRLYAQMGSIPGNFHSITDISNCSSRNGRVSVRFTKTLELLSWAMRKV
jgi:hypothetical protein